MLQLESHMTRGLSIMVMRCPTAATYRLPGQIHARAKKHQVSSLITSVQAFATDYTDSTPASTYTGTSLFSLKSSSSLHPTLPTTHTLYLPSTSPEQSTLNLVVHETHVQMKKLPIPECMRASCDCSNYSLTASKNLQT